MKHTYIYIICTIFITSCNWYESDITETAIARVGNAYLYKSDLEKKIPQNLKNTDSLLFVQDYINEWATNQLLVNGATQNLEENTLLEFDELINQYKSDLYSNAYLEALVSKSVDTLVKDEVAESYYKLNNNVFNLNENLVQLRYIALDKNIKDKGNIINRLKRYDSLDKMVLDSIKIQFKSYALNDSIWVKTNQVINKLPIFTPKNKDQLLKKSNFLQLTDSLDLYLVQIKNVLLRGDIAPLNYVRPTINQIIINKRKVDLLKNIEKDITKDAIKNKQFEIFN